MNVNGLAKLWSIAEKRLEDEITSSAEGEKSQLTQQCRTHN